MVDLAPRRAGNENGRNAGAHQEGMSAAWVDRCLSAQFVAARKVQFPHSAPGSRPMVLDFRRCPSAGRKASPAHRRAEIHERRAACQ